MDSNRIKSILEKYKKGTCSEEEAALIEAWFEQKGSLNKAPVSDTELDYKLYLIKGEIDKRTGGGVRRSPRLINWIAVAATILVVASISFFFINKSRSAKDEASITVAKKQVIERIHNGWVEVITGRGITKNLKLSDGTLVTVNASSHLRYPLNFTGNARPVYLDEGEAYFSVAKDKTKPFTVYTPRFATTALGTAFNIRSYTNEKETAISLLHGKVKVDDLKKQKGKVSSQILEPKQQLVLVHKSSAVIKQEFSSEEMIIGWQRGILNFEDASASEVTTSIENRFGVVIKNNSNLKNWNYTGVFKQESLEEVLQTICLTEGLKYTISGDTVLLH